MSTFPSSARLLSRGKACSRQHACIHDRLQARFLVNPQVSIAVLESAKRLFTVLGQVQRPGTYRFPDLLDEVVKHKNCIVYDFCCYR